MARTQDKILEQLRSNAPRWLKDDKIGAKLLAAAAAAVELIELGLDELIALIFAQTSAGAWLDEIGREVGKPRRPGESDTLYRERLYIEGKGVSLTGLQKLLDELISGYYGEGWSAYVLEPYNVPLEELAIGDAAALALPPLDARPADLIWVSWPDLPVLPPDTSESWFIGDGGIGINALESSSQPWDRRFVWLAAREILNERRAAGVAWGAALDLTGAPLALFNAIFSSLDSEGGILLRT